MADEPRDSDLLARVAKGDQSSFREIVQRHGRYLFTVARSLTNSDSDAEDVVQEVFMALLKSHFRGESALRTFLVAICMRQAALLRRKQKPWMRIASSDEGVMEAQASSAVRSEESAVNAKLDLAELLKQLSPEHREIVILRELEGLSYDEIARTLSIAKGTVESRLYRAREALQQIASRMTRK
jgi:RNA polymerase sigma-70 factor (ECF subfamily)